MISIAIMLCLSLTWTQPSTCLLGNSTVIDQTTSNFTSIFQSLVQQFIGIFQTGLSTIGTIGTTILSNLTELFQSLQSLGQQVGTQITQLTTRSLNSTGVERSRINSQIRQLRYLQNNIQQRLRIVGNRISQITRNNSSRGSQQVNRTQPVNSLGLGDGFGNVV